MKTTLALLFISITFVGCHFFDKNETVHIYDGSSDTTAFELNTLVFKRVSVYDSVLLNQEFISLLMPSDFDLQIKKVWKTSDFTDPFKYFIQLSDTDKTTTFTFFPSLTFITNTSSKPLDVVTINPYTDTLFETSNLPKNALDALSDYVLPIYVKTASNYRIKLKKPLYNIHQLNENGKDVDDETACLHIEYSEGDNVYEQIVYAALEKRFIKIESYNSTCEWRIKNIVSIKTAKGFLNYNLSMFQAIISSTRMNPEWAYYYNYLCSNNFRSKMLHTINDYKSLLRKIPPIAEAQELSVYHTQQNLLRKTFAAYCMYLNNIEYYFDKDGTNIALPKGYIAAWSSTDSRLLVTEVPNYKPNIDELNAWVQIRKNESQMIYNFLEGSSAPDAGNPLFEDDLYH